MRVLASLLLVGFLLLVGAYPGLAVAVGTLIAAVLGLVLHGALALLAQPAIQIAVALAGGAVYTVRRFA
jgi:hypothetical protein